MFTIRYLLWRAIDLYEMIIIASVIVSWIPRTPGSTFDRICVAIDDLADPFLGLFRKFIPALRTSGVALDFSPVLAIMVLDLLKRLL